MLPPFDVQSLVLFSLAKLGKGGYGIRTRGDSRFWVLLPDEGRMDFSRRRGEADLHVDDRSEAHRGLVQAGSGRPELFIESNNSEAADGYFMNPWSQHPERLKGLNP